MNCQCVSTGLGPGSNVLEIIYSKLDSSDVAKTVFLDYSKAFYTIKNDMRLEKT